MSQTRNDQLGGLAITIMFCLIGLYFGYGIAASNSKERAQEAAQVLTQAGYTGIATDGWRFLGCGTKRISVAFKATGPTGVPASGLVCGGVFMGNYSIILN